MLIWLVRTALLVFLPCVESWFNFLVFVFSQWSYATIDTKLIATIFQLLSATSWLGHPPNIGPENTPDLALSCFKPCTPSLPSLPWHYLYRAACIERTSISLTLKSIKLRLQILTLGYLLPINLHLLPLLICSSILPRLLRRSGFVDKLVFEHLLWIEHRSCSWLAVMSKSDRGCSFAKSALELLAPELWRFAPSIAW